MSNYCIGVVTHEKRYDVFSDALKSIRNQTDVDVFVAINGPYKKKFNEEYRNKILSLCLSYKNIYPSFYLQFRGLAKIWNDLIINSCYDNIIISNDDVLFLNGFFEDFLNSWNSLSNKEIMQVGNPSNIPPEIGPAFSTFFVNKLYMNKAGYFNEYYLGIGFEDSEFLRRVGKIFPAFITTKYKNLGGFHNTDISSEGGSCVYKHHVYNSNLFHSGNSIDKINFRPYEDFYVDNRDKFWTNL